MWSYWVAWALPLKVNHRDEKIFLRNLSENRSSGPSLGKNNHKEHVVKHLYIEVTSFAKTQKMLTYVDKECSLGIVKF